MNPHDSSHLPQAPAERHAPIPGWLTGLGLVLAFWGARILRTLYVLALMVAGAAVGV